MKTANVLSPDHSHDGYPHCQSAGHPVVTRAIHMALFARSNNDCCRCHADRVSVVE